jgi:hypothetical protein
MAGLGDWRGGGGCTKSIPNNFLKLRKGNHLDGRKRKVFQHIEVVVLGDEIVYVGGDGEVGKLKRGAAVRSAPCRN